MQSCCRGAAFARPLVVRALAAGGALVAGGGLAAGCGGDEVDVMVTRVGDRPAAVVREVRAANGLGLQEAKLLLTGVPSAVVEDVPREEGERLERRLERAGATVELD
jgi:large subunit ribosomal protein L7/L12